MELDELKNLWVQHEKVLVENTWVNKELLRKMLTVNAEKRVDWIKIKSLAGLILPFIGFIFIVIPRLEFSPRFEVILGLILFLSMFILSYIWAIRLYLLIEKMSFNGPVLAVRKQLKLVEKYKLKIKKRAYVLAPLMIIGIFLSWGIPIFSSKMILFYLLCVIVFLVSAYIRSKHGLLAQLRKIDLDLDEISGLEPGPGETD
jgi:hypothetical protein